MKKASTIFESGSHKWIAVARDPQRPNHLIDTNEYLVVDGEAALLADPGGAEIFPEVFSAICEVFDPAGIRALFASHQDPDVISSLSLWLDFNPKIQCYLSRLWTHYVPHFGGDSATFVHIPDPGMPIQLGKLMLQAVPAHYLHSAGNFQLYDPKARILFSGDVGTAFLPQDHNDLFVKDFDRHIRHAQEFHTRWMGSAQAKLQWCERVAAMEIDMLCPQHGAIYCGADVGRFIDWFAALEVASATA